MGREFRGTPNARSNLLISRWVPAVAHFTSSATVIPLRPRHVLSQSIPANAHATRGGSTAILFPNFFIGSTVLIVLNLTPLSRHNLGVIKISCEGIIGKSMAKLWILSDQRELRTMIGMVEDPMGKIKDDNL
ncbi:hypothetical protein TIFTF001_009742 [Ficus carica]|uniref:Uncharacterized protein n=1 Tax=Ficus carica TaxID=3494 RepID=A0AA87ZWZ4_FICCA|nr:hypothetical protein TIFTF001_009742 [Ficus carica]